MNEGLVLLDYLAVVAYLAVTMWIVQRSSQQQSDTDEFFLGGRSMPWLAVGLSIMATLLSTNTYLGAPGEMIKNGPAYFFGFLAHRFVDARRRNRKRTDRRRADRCGERRTIGRRFGT